MKIKITHEEIREIIKEEINFMLLEDLQLEMNEEVLEEGKFINGLLAAAALLASSAAQAAPKATPGTPPNKTPAAVAVSKAKGVQAPAVKQAASPENSKKMLNPSNLLGMAKKTLSPFQKKIYIGMLDQLSNSGEDLSFAAGAVLEAVKAGKPVPQGQLEQKVDQYASNYAFVIDNMDTKGAATEEDRAVILDLVKRSENLKKIVSVDANPNRPPPK